MKQAWGGTFSENNALSFTDIVPGDAVPTAHHVDKRRLKRKGLEVLFDPAAHKEFVTGFHKRKLQRRKEAQEKLEEKARKQRLEDRAKKREELRERLHLDRYDTPPPSEDEAPAGAAPEPRRVLEYAAGDMQTTVTVAPISMYSDEEPCSSGGEDGEDKPADAQDGAWRQLHVHPGPGLGRPAGRARVPPGARRGGSARSRAGGQQGGGQRAIGSAGKAAGEGKLAGVAGAAGGAPRKRPSGTFSRLAQPREGGAQGQAPRAGHKKQKGAKVKRKRR